MSVHSQAKRSLIAFCVISGIVAWTESREFFEIDDNKHMHMYATQMDSVEIPSSCMASSPGLKARITEKGLNYATRVAIQKLSEKVKDLSIPDQEGKEKHIKYKLYEMKSTSFEAPTSCITMRPNTGLEWKASGASLSMSGRFKYKTKLFADGGRFDFHLSDLDFNVLFTIGSDSAGCPTIKSERCSCDIRSVRIKFHGGASVIYNLITRLIENQIKKMLQEQMCKLLNTVIDKDAANSLAKTPVLTEIGKKFQLDYRFISAPSFQSTYVETYHKGQVYWSKDMVDAPFDAPPMPTGNESSKMLYLWVSDHLFNTAAYSAYKHGELNYSFQLKDLPGSDKEVLNTSLMKFIEKVIPQKHPDDTIELDMNVMEAPTMSTNEEEIIVKARAQCNFYVKSITEKTKTYFLRLTASTSTTSLKLWIADQKVYAKANHIPIAVDDVQTEVFGIGEAVLNIIVQLAVVKCVEEKLNELGGKGFPLPISDEITFENTELKMEKDALTIATDVAYS